MNPLRSKQALAGLLLAIAPAPGMAQAAEPQPASVEAREDPVQVASAVLDRLNAAWNAADGARFAAEFTDDADVINIFGEPFHGRADLASRMQLIFDGIFKGSVHVGREIEVARYLAPDTILVVSSARIAVPAGPMSPETSNRQTLILVKDGDGWRIRHWHNTTVGRPS
jgi:uncharacterized protein (TIGR02246 family)